MTTAPHDTRPELSRRQAMRLERFSAGSDELVTLLDEVDRHVPLDPEAAARARAVLAGGCRLLAGSGLTPTAPLPPHPDVMPGDLLVALLSTHAALQRFLEGFAPPALEIYPRAPRRR